MVRVQGIEERGCRHHRRVHIWWRIGCVVETTIHVHVGPIGRVEEMIEGV